MPAPLVSVVMPARNAAAFLREAIDSILTQTWRELELIVVDDGSTDDTRAIAEELGAADGRLRVISPGGSQNAKSGLVAALNRGFSEARGDLVARMDADDLAYPDRIAQQVAYLDRKSVV